jgi:hypothetical protein
MGLDEQAVDALLNKWCMRVKRSQLAHRFAAKQLNKFHLLLGGSAAVLSTITGTSIFASLEKGLSGYGRIVVGVTSLLAALLSALQTFLRLDESSNKHQKADAGYSAIRQQIEQYRVTQYQTSNQVKDVDEFLNSIRQQMEELTADSPIVHERYWQKARVVLAAQDARKKKLNDSI